MVDFIGHPKKIRMTIKGVAGDSLVTFVGTVKWMIEDNNGKKHTFHIPNTYYHKQVPYRLLSPQHWAAEQGDHSNCTRCETYSNRAELVGETAST
jgi:hypothetical protein